MRGRPHHLTDRFPKGRLGQLGRRLVRLAHRRKFHDRVRVKFERGAGGRDRDRVAVVSEGHRAWFETPDDVSGQARRNDAAPVVDPDHFVGHLDRQVEVGTGDAQGVPGTRQQQAQEHGRRTTAGTDGTARSRQHLHECIALRSELHRCQSFREVPQPFMVKREVYVSCKGSKGCGLWMTSSSPCSAGPP